MTEKEIVDEHDYGRNMKAVIVRDFFPDLKTGPDDETINRYNLTTYCQTFIGDQDYEFVSSVDKDRLLLRSSAPNPKINEEMVKQQYRPWTDEKYNALFYEPKEFDGGKSKALKYDKKRCPKINYDQTRFHDKFGNTTIADFPRYHPFTTESSTTESESEFEGRSVYRQQLLEDPKHIRKDRLEKVRRRNELSSKGKTLLKSLPSVD
ncbi:hypothetical protein M9Y10_023512 [Tritrichomonas musculus]|uniref:Uncharacterized protein n=1 Tax=Tritrichomonas musculus TaxID=1915356 RepID=A0ABR2KYH4_9EUKA